MSFHGFIALSFLSLNNISLSGCITFLIFENGINYRYPQTVHSYLLQSHLQTQTAENNLNVHQQWTG